VIPIVTRPFDCEIPIALVDPPLISMRSAHDSQQYQQLKESIQANGIQVLLIVERRDGRYRIAAGETRWLIAKELGAASVPCDVREPGVLDEEAIKVLENDDREAVNAADAANYLARLYVERCGQDVDQVCALVKRTRGYVENRLSLFQGDAEILEAVGRGDIGLGVAIELNKIVNVGYRKMHLYRALGEGMTEAAARKARQQSNFATGEGTAPKVPDAPAVDVAATPAEARYVCTVCLGSDHPERMRWITVHEHCQLAILEKILAPFRAAQVEDTPVAPANG
jgi:ParB/RepB/Spo0J family partition protein